MLKQVWREQDAYARKKKADLKSEKQSPHKWKSLDLHKGKGTMSTSTMSSAMSTANMNLKSVRGTTLSSKSSMTTCSSPMEDDDQMVEHTMDVINYYEWRGQSIVFRDLLAHYLYQYVIFVMIAFSALTELVVLQRGSTHITILVVNLLLQILFSVDLYVQIVATYPNFHFYFQSKWQCFDAIVVVATWVPVFAWGRGSGVLGASRH
jgi:hypothetical protein